MAWHHRARPEEAILVLAMVSAACFPYLVAGERGRGEIWCSGFQLGWVMVVMPYLEAQDPALEEEEEQAEELGQTAEVELTI